MAYNNAAPRGPAPKTAAPAPYAGGRGGERKQSILLFKATDRDTGEPKVSKGGKEYYRISLTDEQIAMLKTAGPGCALYMEEQSGISKKNGIPYSGFALSVLPARK